jgi:hypothetical protein
MSRQGRSQQLDPIIALGDLTAGELQKPVTITFRDISLNQGMETVVEGGTGTPNEEPHSYRRVTPTKSERGPSRVEVVLRSQRIHLSPTQGEKGKDLGCLKYAFHRSRS